MGLTKGSGPLAGPGSAPTNYAIDGPPHRLHLEPYPRRLRAVVAGRVVLDTTAAHLVMETRMLPVAYAPLADMDAAVLERTATTTHCPFKGDASYWSVAGVPDALWGYEDPLPAAAWLRGLVALDRDKVDHFVVEDDVVFGPHLRDPYTRVDVHASSRTAVVRVAGTEVARTTRPLLLFETGLPVRVYVPWADVDAAALVPSATRTRCPYKGEASYFDVGPGTDAVRDAAWTYPTPLEGCLAVAGHLSFDGEGVEVELDG